MNASRQRIAAIVLMLGTMVLPAGVLCAQGPESNPITRTSVENNRLRDGKTPPADSSWVNIVLALALVAGLIFLARFFLRRAGAGALPKAGGALEVLWRTTLSMKHQLLLVRMGRRVLLLSAGPHGLSTLSELTDAAEIAELMESVEAAGAGSFTNMLKTKARQYQDKNESNPNKPATPADAPLDAVQRLKDKIQAHLRQKDQDK